MTLHATLLVALHVIPNATSRRFSSAGQTQVVSIEASFATPPSFSATLVSVEPLSMKSELDDFADQAPPHEQRFEVTARPLDRMERSARTDLPRLQRPTAVPHAATAERLMIRRRSFASSVPVSENLPVVRPVVDQKPPTRLQSVTKPPAFVTTPVKQVAGLKEREPADFTSNPPPNYPRAAVAQGLEGTVLLRLHVSNRGDVVDVEIIRSSGHGVLDRAAVDAVTRWKGSPARRWGRATDSVEVLPLRFKL